MGGRVISLLPARLEELTLERWRRLVQQVADHRGVQGENVDALGQTLWFEEWCPAIADDAYADEIRRRLEALQVLRFSEPTESQRDRALSIVTAPLPPTLFRQHVLEAQSRRDGWNILLGRPQIPLPDEIAEIPPCYSHLVWGPRLEWGEDDYAPF